MKNVETRMKIAAMSSFIWSFMFVFVEEKNGRI